MAQPDIATTGKPGTKGPSSGVRIKTIATGLGGMIAGAFIGVGVQAGIEATGVLGPSVEALISEQEANFADVQSRLDAIQGAASDPAVKQSLGELGELLGRQNQLSQRAGEELRYLGMQITDLKERSLSESGLAGGADFWLKEGESVNVAGKDQVFALITNYRGTATVNLSGTRKRLAPGDQMMAESGGRICTVFFKQAEARADGRLGFDLSCTEAE